jgi:hypothetical protein
MVVAGSAVWLGVVAKRAHDQKKVVREVLAMGGTVQYDYNYAGYGATYPRKTDPPGPARLRNVIGEDYFISVVEVNLGFLKAKPSTEPLTSVLRQLRNLPKLQTLDLVGTGATDSQLDYIADLTQLQTLRLSGAPIGDEGLIKLSRLKKLESLGVNGTQVTDKSLETLRSLPKLKELVLSETAVTDDGLIHVGKLSDLESLHLHNTGVTDRGIQSLSELHKLTHLDLSGTQITDKGLSKLPS